MVNKMETEDINVKDLKPRSRSVNLVVKVLKENEIRDVESRKDGSKHRVCEATVGDETGTVLLTLWDELIDEINEGDVYQIKNGYTSLYRNNIRLNIGKYGELEKVDQEIAEVDEGNDMSEKHHEDRRRYESYGGHGDRDNRSNYGGYGRY